jgi:hypothetical protein
MTDEDALRYTIQRRGKLGLRSEPLHPTSPPVPEPESDSAEPQRSFPWAAGRK